ncbi:MAG TPA: glycosyltransferase [Magnetospirillaceae bacterium]|nr:glycosyltransferase [Magnetospirillaceae bacterium]
MRATIQLCTYNRAHLLGRVLEACFEQTVRDYEVVLVDDGSKDATPLVIERAQATARVPFIVVSQANAGLAKARNSGLRRATGERIIFIDDDILPMPNFVAEHLRSHASAPDAIVRGAVINTESFDDLPPPIWTAANYSGNYFWTSNVSIARKRLDAVGGFFDESFSEYGWEDIELGLRLRFAGTRSVFNRFAVAFHYKPRPTSADLAQMLRQARAQARTAAQLQRLHPHWRVALATGDTPLQRGLARALRSLPRRSLERLVGDPEAPRRLGRLGFAAARTLAAAAYYEELEWSSAQ